ncbi:unnamed protein product [Closterium sp. Yama58-4]|nr:unnamed protein product [Closterium sp. Yama58-4]
MSGRRPQTVRTVLRPDNRGCGSDDEANSHQQRLPSAAIIQLAKRSEMDSLQQLSSDVAAIESLASRGTLDVDSWNKLELLASKLAKRASCGKDALIITGLYLGLCSRSTVWTLHWDAAQRFSQLLLDGNFMPGCYIPMLISLASRGDILLPVRLAALRSLSSFLLLSVDLAKRHRTLVTRLLEDEEKPVKVAALATVAKLILTSPNEFPDFLDGVSSLMDSDTSDAQLEAYAVYAHLLLSKKMKAQGFMKRLAVGLLHKDNRIKGLMKELVTQLMDGNAKSRCVLVLSMFKQCPKDQKDSLARTLVNEVLAPCDLETEELGSSVLQLLRLGQNEAVQFLPKLHPSKNLVSKIDSWTQLDSAKVGAMKSKKTSQSLLEFVNRYRPASAVEKDTQARVIYQLEKICGSHESRAQLSYQAQEVFCIEDYEREVSMFKDVRLDGSLADLL